MEPTNAAREPTIWLMLFSLSSFDKNEFNANFSKSSSKLYPGFLKKQWL
jgi:hypothetical protein